jgi:hypothetical protein
MNTRKDPFLVLAPLMIFLWVISIIGWCSNLWKLTTEWGIASQNETIIRLIGAIFYPIGCVIGWF